MNQVNALGDMCPIPVVKAKKALQEMNAGTLEVLVDNEIAVANIKRLASSLGCGFSFEKENDERYKIEIVKTADTKPQEASKEKAVAGKTIVVIPSNVMGIGDEALGKQLMKGFIYAITQLEDLPDTILLYNGGAFLSVEGSESLADLQALETAGVAVMTCGACLNHYQIADKLRVGTVTNMYAIVETMNEAGRILRP